ncbi:YitT family protein [Sulfuriroseicoccus oceanibius]|uniref:YitT family protein n=1 Tax=Sulfuriroseicoccus oceanibius TaxID=2707525 RepID=A0A6B3L4I6_9BACT|nr:YitT family protein [Sulfuriroseicoccus oceanibius]QQL45921.1 YitT family protein [Sulfuriroseicoccus oceanibius]
MERSPTPPVIRVPMLLLGIVILSWGFNSLLLANEVLIGGLPGFSILVLKQFGMDPSVTQWALGIPIFFIGWAFLGRREIINSLGGALVLPLVIWLMRDVFPLQVGNQVLAAVFGGLTCGLGLGLIFRANATVGGFSIIARIFSRWLGVPISHCMLAIDGVIVLAAGSFFGAEAAMLALLSVFSLSKAIDIVQTGVGGAKSVTIITENEEAMREMLLQRLDSGATVLKATGAHSGDDRAFIVSVVPRAKVARLRRNIKRVDPAAFTVITDASEVLGYGFQDHG